MGTIELKECYVFNSEYGDEHDNEMGKILYYYPAETDDNTQLKRVGLCEAIIKFTRNFESEAPCDSLHTQKCRFVFIQPEVDFWFVLVLSIPTVIRITHEGQEVIDYHNDQVQDNVFQAVLLRIYQKFILFNDKLNTNITKKGLPELKIQLRKFIDINIKKVDMNQCGISDIFQGIQFLPLNRHVFLKVQCFINQLLMSLPQIRHLLLLQGEKLIWSGVGHGDIQVFYEYLVHDLLSQHIMSGVDRQSTFGFIFKKASSIYLSDPSPLIMNNNNTKCPESTTATLENETGSNSGSNGEASIDSFATASSSAFVNLPKDDKKSHCKNKIVEKKRFHMLVYKSEQSYLTMLLDDHEELGNQLIGQIELFLSVNFTPLAQMLIRDRSSMTSGGNLGTNCSPAGLVNQSSTSSLDSISPNIKFVYFNNLNLAEKMSPGCPCEQDSYRLLSDLKSDLSRMSENGEIVVKMISDTWIVAKTSNRREFYAIFNHKGSNLLEIDEELKKLTDAHLSNIFFQD